MATQPVLMDSRLRRRKVRGVWRSRLLCEGRLANRHESEIAGNYRSCKTTTAHWNLPDDDRDMLANSRSIPEEPVARESVQVLGRAFAFFKMGATAGLSSSGAHFEKVNHPEVLGGEGRRASRPVDLSRTDQNAHLVDYYATVTHHDYEIGRVLDTIRARGWFENTVMIFTSDQGLAVGGRYGLMGKQNLYEHVKPPLVIAGQSIPHGQSDALVYLYDLFPTICELCGAPTPDVVEGRSLLPIVQGKQTALRESLLCAYSDCQRMVRDKRWKLMAYNAAGEKHTQLFDLDNDQDELTNLADDPRFAAERQRPAKLFAKSRRDFGDSVEFDIVREARSTRKARHAYSSLVRFASCFMLTVLSFHLTRF